MYALVLGGYVLRQMTLEAAASGCIPLVLRVPEGSDSNQDPHLEDSVIFFRTPDDLPDLIDQNHQPDLEYLSHKYSYENFVRRVLHLVKGEFQFLKQRPSHP